LEDFIRFHHDLEGVLPFQDGNGRVGRLLLFEECLKHDIIPFVIDEKHKNYYYRGLREFKDTPEYLLTPVFHRKIVIRDIWPVSGWIRICRKKTGKP
jgi:hypothetical protein